MITSQNNIGLDFLTMEQGDFGLFETECGDEPCLPEDINHYDQAGLLITSQRALFPRREKSDVYDPTDPEGWNIDDSHPYGGDIY